MALVWRVPAGGEERITPRQACQTRLRHVSTHSLAIQIVFVPTMEWKVYPWSSKSRYLLRCFDGLEMYSSVTMGRGR